MSGLISCRFTVVLAQLPQLTDLRFIDRSEHGLAADHMLPLHYKNLIPQKS
jgi:hypothetical protein